MAESLSALVKAAAEDDWGALEEVKAAILRSAGAFLTRGLRCRRDGKAGKTDGTASARRRRQPDRLDCSKSWSRKWLEQTTAVFDGTKFSLRRAEIQHCLSSKFTGNL